jgi:N-acetylmuramoyl-L-alanine amidase
MRDINYLVVHCTGTPINTSIASIKRYWKNVLGWRNPGYHFIIERDGNVENLLSVDKVSNGVRGYNSKSIHVSYIGGQYEDDRTYEQKEAIENALTVLKAIYPNAEIKGHRDFPKVKKACPQFNAIEEYEHL